MKTQLEFRCAQCNDSKVTAIGDFNLEDKKFTMLSCGHIIADELIRSVDKFDNFQSLEGDKAYPFQIEAMKFIEDSNFRCLIADEMGLGKTIDSLGALRYHPEKLPVLFVVKRKLTRQFFKQIYRWCDKSLSQIIEQGHAILPGFQYYIISMDLIRNYPMERFESIGIKTVIIDECQHIKNENSQRTHFLRKFILDNNIQHIIALSGTPFKNRLSEYFTILNILAPQYFQNREEFIRSEIAYYYDMSGKLREKGLKNPKRFKSITEKFIIRRERQDVGDQIPFVGIRRDLQYVDLEGKFAQAYSNAESEFQHLFDRIDNEKNAMSRNSDLLAILQRMRHIVGLSKIPDTVDFVTDFLMSTERKICIFLHHQDVARMVTEELNKWAKMGGFSPVLQIKGSMPDDELNDVVEKFNTVGNGYRILVASTLAAGEGLNLQNACSECVIMEHQWNAANEEQAEARFRRIGQSRDNVIATYMVAGNTIDEMLTEIKERKRALVKNGMLSKDTTPFSESELISQLADMIGKKRAGIKWKMN